jgi:hypothetical protein
VRLRDSETRSTPKTATLALTEEIYAITLLDIRIDV